MHNVNTPEASHPPLLPRKSALCAESLVSFLVSTRILLKTLSLASPHKTLKNGVHHAGYRVKEAALSCSLFLAVIPDSQLPPFLTMHGRMCQRRGCQRPSSIYCESLEIC